MNTPKTPLQTALDTDAIGYAKKLLLECIFPATREAAEAKLREEAFAIIGALKSLLERKPVCPECEGRGEWDADTVLYGNEHSTAIVICFVCDGAGRADHVVVRNKYRDHFQRKFGS